MFVAQRGFQWRQSLRAADIGYFNEKLTEVATLNTETLIDRCDFVMIRELIFLAKATTSLLLLQLTWIVLENPRRKKRAKENFCSKRILYKDFPAMYECVEGREKWQFEHTEEGK